MNEVEKSSPLLPRRAFLAATLSAVCAGGAIGLATLGAVTRADVTVFQFSRGRSLANGEEERLRGVLSRALLDDRVHVTIRAHTAVSGDAAANLLLSQTRAELVESLARGLGVPAHRITASGVGGAAPLAQKPDEGDRAYQARLARVEVSLQVRK